MTVRMALNQEKWLHPRPHPIIPRGLTVYCQEPTTLHDICPGYSIATTEAQHPTGDRHCACTCHEGAK
jgi:hypothetical protein